MAFTRLLTLAALAACLAVPASAAATDVGVVPADPHAGDASDGGIVAPAEEPSAVAAEPAQGDAPEAAQEDTPTTPEGEEQPPEEQPDGEQPPTEEDGGETAPEGGEVDGTGGEAGDTLPRTGFELAALTAIGLGLLLAGAALWPTSSWPPPRDRLSRSSLPR
jgi:hypothetical protein